MSFAKFLSTHCFHSLYFLLVILILMSIQLLKFFFWKTTDTQTRHTHFFQVSLTIIEGIELYNFASVADLVKTINEKTIVILRYPYVNCELMERIVSKSCLTYFV